MTGVLCTISPQNGLVPGADMVRWNGAFGNPMEVQRYFDRLAVPRLLDLPGARSKPRTSTISDDEWLEFAQSTAYEYVGLSYVKSADWIFDVKGRLRGSRTGVIAKIETREAVDNIESIVEASDGVMIDRGDLSRAIGVLALGAVQKRVAQSCRRGGKVLIVATGVFASMRADDQPGISEVSDAFNAVLDGADYLMLAEETAIGKHPELVVAALRKVVDAAVSYQALTTAEPEEGGHLRSLA
ncbi:MAG: pyruvate kinase [Deltaproteobacteria bacterium]|nr:pyruvate kinase [Deltaproteobacteria bacterium]